MKLTKSFLKGVYKRHHSEIQFLKSPRCFLPGTKKSSHFKSSHCAGQLKSGTVCVLLKRSKASLSESKKSLLECLSTERVHKRRSSICQLAKVSANKRSIRRSSEKIADSMKRAKNLDFHETSSTSTVVEKQPRSYAEMIASYSEKMYAQSNLGILKDGVSFTTMNEIHRSPFSTASVVSLKWKHKEKATKKSSFPTTGVVQQSAQFSSGASMARYDCRNDNRTIFPTFGENNDVNRISSSYASMIEKYSNAISSDISTYSSNNSMVPKRSVSTKLDEDPMTFLSAKSIDDKSTHVVSNSTEATSNSLTEAEKINMEVEAQIGWITRVEDIINDLKQVTAKKEAADIQTSDRWMLQSVNERAHWLDRVVKAHKKMMEEKRSMSAKTLGHGKVTESTKMEEFNSKESSLKKSNLKMSTSKETYVKQSTSNDYKLKKDTVAPHLKSEQPTHKPPQVPQMTASSNKPSNPISQYINRGPPAPNSPTKSTSQSPTNVSPSPTKEPQIELRMTPSQNESVVSINVDEQTAKTAGTKDQLSVVISSNRHKAGKVDSNLNLRQDFGSMQISISENTVPVKQIEFSINGKPVSELKSIVARADKLDVVGSMDKLEIRIPSSKEKVSEHPATLTKTTGSTPVLNLQIAAKFNEPRAQQPNTEVKPETNTTPHSVPPAPAKPRTMFTPNISRSEAAPIVTNVKNLENIPRSKQIDTSLAFETPGAAVDQETITRTAEKNHAAITKNPAVFHNVNSDRNTPVVDPNTQPSMNIETPKTDKSREERVPSNTIPWWSSEDSFKKIKKKNNTPKSAKTVKDESTPKWDKENESVVHKTGQKLSPGVVYEEQYNPADSSKTSAPGKDVLATKPVLDEEKKPRVPDSTFRTIRVRSPSRRMAKPATGVKTLTHIKGNTVSNSRIAKKIKYRSKSNVMKSNVTTKKKLPESIAIPHTPKVYKYVSVNPQRVNVEKKPETTKATSLNPKRDEQRMAPSKVEAPKVETKAKADAKVESSQGSTPHRQSKRTEFKIDIQGDKFREIC